MRKLFAIIISFSFLLASCKTRPAPIGWTLIKTQTSPPVFSHGAVAYDSASKQAVLFGGITTDKWLDETWIWNGKDWAKASPANHPSAREKVAMAYDEARNRVVLFGGVMDKMLFDDTWEWDGKDWHLITSVHRPPARCCHAMAYDSVQKKVLLYGGWDSINNVFFKDTWVWDGADWVEVTCCNAPAASAHALVDFSSRNEIVALNSVDAFGTWVWNGDSWHNPVTNITPARQDGRLTYDSEYKRVVLFGGIRKGEYLNDTWIFDGTDWIAVSLPIQPPARYSHIMFYDVSRQGIILFGGASSEGLLNDTWELNLPKDLSSLLLTRTPSTPP